MLEHDSSIMLQHDSKCSMRLRAFGSPGIPKERV